MEIKEVINRWFCFCWISQELFLKNGKSYFFNFFNEKNSTEIFEIFKSKKVTIIKNPKEYFEKEEFSKKWKENIISTYDYLLILNKFSSRSYNDINQYPAIPWINLSDNKIRNFDNPISLQKDNIIEDYLQKFNEYNQNNNNVFHNNHYSTGAYILFYLMRINPFCNNMIKFQSNSFDIPDRQFIGIKGTLELCEEFNNNREAIPEIFELPEIYYNINYNDFGKLKDNVRIHNIILEPYSKNGIEFCYIYKHKINYDLEINKNINKWFDFIFGINQWKSNPKDNPLRLFNSHSYAQNVNIKKLILDLRKQKKEESNIYDYVKSNVGYSINFGQCPLQILSEPHPLKNFNYIYENKMDENNKNKDNTIKIDEICNIINKYKYKVSFFYKNKNNKNIICLFKNGFLGIYNTKKKNTSNYELLKEIRPKGLLYSNANKYSFCELDDNLFIFCGYLDKTLKIYCNDSENKYLLDSYVTSIIKINETEFVTGHHDGKLTKWVININNVNNNINYKFQKLSINSNNNCITCLEYNYRLNILLSSDNNSIIIRNYYNLEFLTIIKIKQNNINLNSNIKSIKISNYNIIYVLIQIKEDQLYELHCYSLNGTFSCKIAGNFNQFELTHNGNIIIPDINNRLIKVLRPYDFFLIHSNSFPFIKNNKKIFHILYENSNLIYLCIEEKDSIKIKKIQINKSKEMYFI